MLLLRFLLFNEFTNKKFTQRLQRLSPKHKLRSDRKILACCKKKKKIIICIKIIFGKPLPNTSARFCNFISVAHISESFASHFAFRRCLEWFLCENT